MSLKIIKCYLAAAKSRATMENKQKTFASKLSESEIRLTILTSQSNKKGLSVQVL